LKSGVHPTRHILEMNNNDTSKSSEGRKFAVIVSCKSAEGCMIVAAHQQEAGHDLDDAQLF